MAAMMAKGLKGKLPDEELAVIEAEENQMREDLEEIQKIESKVKDRYSDPVQYFGFGIMSFYGLLKGMIVMMFLLTLSHVPLMLSYSSWNALNMRSLGTVNQFTIGNMGESRTRCIQSYLAVENLMLGCSTGKITNILHFGVYQDAT